MTIFKRLKNLWYLSGLATAQSGQLDLHKLESVWPKVMKKKMATIVSLEDELKDFPKEET